MKAKIKLVCLALIAMGSTALNSCSKDSKEFPIEEAVGTYRGTLKVMVPKVPHTEIKDAKVTITKVSDTELRVTPDPKYGATAKTFTVESIEGDLMNPDVNDPKGIFIYEVADKYLSVTTNREVPTEANFIFKGNKQ